MIGAKIKAIPTKFAIAMALDADLYVPESQERERQQEWFELRDRLEAFQKMALSSPYEVCLHAYYGIRLTDKQKEQLKLIHKYTKDWVYGHVIENLISVMEDRMTPGRDKAAIGELVVSAVNPKSTSTDKEKVKTGIIVKLAKEWDK